MKKIAIQTYQSTIKYLSNFTQTQLALTLISIPILVSWGLGFSAMSFVGNLVFTPVLTIFLIISSLLLFTELVGIPNGALAKLLDTLTAWWNVLLHKGSAQWLLAWAKPPAIILLVIPLITIGTLRWRWVTTIYRRLALMSILALATCGVLYLTTYTAAPTNLAQLFDQRLYTIKLTDQRALIVVDEGYFSRKKSIEKAIDFELKPWITKQYGMITIKEIRLYNPGKGCFQAALHMCTIWNVEALCVPFFKKKLNKVGWRMFFELQRYAQEHGIAWVRIAPKNKCSSVTARRQAHPQKVFVGKYKRRYRDTTQASTHACWPTHAPTERY